MSSLTLLVSILAVVLVTCTGLNRYEWQLGAYNQLQVRRNSRNGTSAWGSVCDDSFNNNTADAVCGFMGYNNAIGWHRANRVIK